MTALRQRMMEDMHLAGLCAGTQMRYLTGVEQLVRTYHRSPDRITEEEVRKHVLSLRDERGAARGTFQTHWHGIRFFYLRTLGVEWGLFLKKKWANQSSSACLWRGATKNAVICCRA